MLGLYFGIGRSRQNTCKNIYIPVQYLNPSLTWLMSCKHDVTNPTMSFDENSSCAGFHSKVYHHSPVGFSKEGCPLRLSTKQWKGQQNNRSMTELISLIIYEWDVLKCIGVSMYPKKICGSRTQRVNEPIHFADEKIAVPRTKSQASWTIPKWEALQTKPMSDVGLDFPHSGMYAKSGGLLSSLFFGGFLKWG